MNFREISRTIPAMFHESSAIHEVFRAISRAIRKNFPRNSRIQENTRILALTKINSSLEARTGGSLGQVLRHISYMRATDFSCLRHLARRFWNHTWNGKKYFDHRVRSQHDSECYRQSREGVAIGKGVGVDGLTQCAR